jgi:hypothetical protein
MRFALALLGAAIASGAAFAGAAGVTTGVQPVITCVHNGNSQLRLANDIGDCGNDTVVSWNATVGSFAGSGQVGDVFTTSDETNFVTIPADTHTQLLKLALPPGSYAVSSKVQLGAFDSRPLDFGVACSIGVDGTAFGDVAEANLISSSVNQTLSMQFVGSFDKAVTVRLTCFNESGQVDSPGFKIFAENMQLTALVVGTVHTQP